MSVKIYDILNLNNKFDDGYIDNVVDNIDKDIKRKIGYLGNTEMLVLNFCSLSIFSLLFTIVFGMILKNTNSGINIIYLLIPFVCLFVSSSFLIKRIINNKNNKTKNVISTILKLKLGVISFKNEPNKYNIQQVDYNDYAVNYNYNQILNDELNLIIENDLKFKNHISYYHSFLKIIKKLDSNEKNELNILLDYLNNNKNNDIIHVKFKEHIKNYFKKSIDNEFILLDSDIYALKKELDVINSINDEFINKLIRLKEQHIELTTKLNLPQLKNVLGLPNGTLSFDEHLNKLSSYKNIQELKEIKSELDDCLNLSRYEVEHLNKINTIVNKIEENIVKYNLEKFNDLYKEYSALLKLEQDFSYESYCNKIEIILNDMNYIIGFYKNDDVICNIFEPIVLNYYKNIANNIENYNNLNFASGDSYLKKLSIIDSIKNVLPYFINFNHDILDKYYQNNEILNIVNSIKNIKTHEDAERLLLSIYSINQNLLNNYCKEIDVFYDLNKMLINIGDKGFEELINEKIMNIIDNTDEYRWDVIGNLTRIRNIDVKQKLLERD